MRDLFWKEFLPIIPKSDAINSPYCRSRQVRTRSRPIGVDPLELLELALTEISIGKKAEFFLLFVASPKVPGVPAPLISFPLASAGRETKSGIPFNKKEKHHPMDFVVTIDCSSLVSGCGRLGRPMCHISYFSEHNLLFRRVTGWNLALHLLFTICTAEICQLLALQH